MDESEFSMEELNGALKEAARGKAPGLDGIPAEFWQALADGGRGTLLSFYNRCWREEVFPDQWGQALVVGIFKKGAADDPANYRPISLLQTAYKLFGRMVARRLETGLDARLRKTQYGFRNGRSTAEPMFILRRLQDLVHAKRRQVLHLIFLDWSKAFDKIATERLPEVLRRFGTPNKVISVIEALVKNKPKSQATMGGM